MKKRKFTYLLIILLFVSYNCTQDNIIPSNNCATKSTKVTKLLCLGDSRVEGFSPVHESYRYPLWKLFIDNNNCVDFIGNRLDNFAPYDNYKGETFDIDHLAEGGAYTSTLLLILQEDATSLQPDIVLLGIGGNDLNEMVNTVEQTISNIELIINSIRTLNPKAIIIVEQIAPARSDLMTSKLQNTLESFNSRVASLADLKSTSSSPVIAVDMSLGWSDSYMADELHYNQIGAEVIAKRYYEILKGYLE